MELRIKQVRSGFPQKLPPSQSSRQALYDAVTRESEDRGSVRGMGRSDRTSHSMVVLFALMADGQDRDGRRVLDLEKRNIARRSERTHEFPQ